MKLDLRQGICKNEQYDAWKFPGGEIHFKLKLDVNFVNKSNYIIIITRLNTSDDIMFLLIVNDVLKKDYKQIKRTLFIPYMPYQQADRDFGIGECFSLKTIANLINSMEFDRVDIFANHSDVTPALINNSRVIDNSEFITKVLKHLSYPDNELVIISPDAGSYKLIFKLCEKIGFKGEIITCSKSRNHDSGEITTVVPKFDESKPVLIIDDIALGSRTFFNIRREIKNTNVYLAVSHGIFNENVDKLGEEFNVVFTTNSRRNESIGKNIEIINIF